MNCRSNTHGIFRLAKRIGFLAGAFFISTAVNAQAPVITSFTPVSGPPGTLVTIQGTNLGNASSLIIGGDTAIIVSDIPTQIVGMVMPRASTGTLLVTTPAGVASDTLLFTVKPTQYPNMQQGNKLSIPESTPYYFRRQGNSVAVSADGNTVLTGAPSESVPYNQDGTFVYSRLGGIWTQQTFLHSPPLYGGPNAIYLLGWAVAISADGNTAVAGDPYDQPSSAPSSSEIGGVWFYTRSGGLWTQQGSLQTGTGYVYGSHQGSSVSISADGKTALVGGYQDSLGVGGCWIFTQSGGVWSQVGNKLKGSGSVGRANQGRSVALSADGHTAIIGGQTDSTGGIGIGAVWIFVDSAGIWKQQGSKLVGTGAIGPAQQGSSVSLSADGNTAIVGGSNDNGGRGAVWVYTRSGGVWTQQGPKLTGAGMQGTAQLGASVSVSADGNTVLAGGPTDHTDSFSGLGEGAVWVFTRSGGVWIQPIPKMIGSGSTAYKNQPFQGCSVSLSADGNTAVVGGKFDGCCQNGAAWIFMNGAESMPGNSTWLYVYPNPGSNLINIRAMQAGEYSLANACGQIIRQFTLPVSCDYILQTDDLSAGMYFIYGVQNNQVVRQKLMIIK
ncbi:MAG TPA: IPT/TIG domain-containing protein [Bacteroidia bacterium]|nr:IPT/TIG domain-containing protein [Bacteroidia bacterium]